MATINYTYPYRRGSTGSIGSFGANEPLRVIGSIGSIGSFGSIEPPSQPDILAQLAHPLIRVSQ